MGGRTNDQDRLAKEAVAHELAQKIDTYLKRFERDPKINPKHDHYYGAYACMSRGRVWVVYVAYQGGSPLSVEEAIQYLAQLSAGNIGKHYQLTEAK
jgi:predicted glycoside hydrolase/deacetylase ChbG (UPF0249 family)